MLGPGDPMRVALAFNALGTGLAILELCRLLPGELPESCVATYVHRLETPPPNGNRAKVGGENHRWGGKSRPPWPNR